MVLILGVTNAILDPKTDPPVGLLYQFNTPALAVAAKATVPVPQREAEFTDVTDGVVVTVAMTGVRAEIQLPLLAST